MNSRRLVAVASCTALLLCIGCWEEVHYVPTDDSPAAGQPVVSGRQPLSNPVTGAEAIPAREELPNPPPVSTDSQQAPEAFDDLFASDETTEREVSPTGSVLAISPEVTAQAVWQLASHWSMASALRARGVAPDKVDAQIDEAAAAAQQLQIELPSLPPTAAEDDDSIDFLLEVAGPKLSETIGEEFGPRYAALAELAIKSHCLLLSYSPSNQRNDEVAAAIRAAAESSELPEQVWGQLVELLDERADFAAVKQAVFQMHQQAAAHLSSADMP